MYTVVEIMLYNKIIYKYGALKWTRIKWTQALYENIFCFTWCQGTTTDAQTLNGF